MRIEAHGIGALELHGLDGTEEESNVVKMRSTWLLKKQPDTAHLLVGKESGQLVVVVPSKGWAGPSAKELLAKVLDEAGDPAGAKGGGAATFAQGNLGRGAQSAAATAAWLRALGGRAA